MRSSKRDKKQKLNRISFFSDGVDLSDINRIIYSAEQLFKDFGIKADFNFGGDVWEKLKNQDEISKKLVRIRVFKWNEQSLADFVSPAEMNFEIRRMKRIINSFGVIYDGFLLSGVFFEVLSKKLGAISLLPIVITNRQIATFGEDGRYHLRICVIGFPTVISTNGFFSAPAKPLEYHLTKMVNEDLAILKGHTIKEYIQKKIPIISRAYILESLVWNFLGIPFCSNEFCLLSDSHTVDEIIYSKIKKLKLCDVHKEAVSSIRSI